jgi:hypothetical protein
MGPQLTLDDVVVPSQDVVARRIEGELLLVPLTPGIGDDGDEIFTLNETGSEIWDRLDGTRTLREVAAELAELYDDPGGAIEADVLGIVGELVKRQMVVAGPS